MPPLKQSILSSSLYCVDLPGVVRDLAGSQREFSRDLTAHARCTICGNRISRVTIVTIVQSTSVRLSASRTCRIATSRRHRSNVDYFIRHNYRYSTMPPRSRGSTSTDWRRRAFEHDFPRERADARHNYRSNPSRRWIVPRMRAVASHVSPTSGRCSESYRARLRVPIATCSAYPEVKLLRITSTTGSGIS